MVNYKELGLVNTREMFKRAINGGYAASGYHQGLFRTQVTGNPSGF